MGFVQQPQQGDQFRRQGVPVDQVHGRHRVGRLLADGDVGSVLADGRQGDGTPDGLLGVVDALAGRVDVDLRAGVGGVEFGAVVGGQLGDDVDERALGVEGQIRRDAPVVAEVGPREHLHALVDAVGLDVFERVVPDGDGEFAVAHQIAHHVVQQVVESVVGEAVVDRWDRQIQFRERRADAVGHGVNPLRRVADGQLSREQRTGALADELHAVLDQAVDAGFPDPFLAGGDEFLVAGQQVRFADGIFRRKGVAAQQMLPVDDDGDLELVEGDGMPFDAFAGEALDVLRVLEVGGRRRVVLGVDDDGVLAHVGHVDAVVKGVGGQVVQTGQRTERVVGHPPPGGRRAVHEAVDDPPVFRVEPAFHPFDSPLAGPRPVDVRAVEVRLDGIEGVALARCQLGFTDLVVEAVGLAYCHDDARVYLVLFAHVGCVPRCRVVRRQRCRHRRPLLKPTHWEVLGALLAFKI